MHKSECLVIVGFMVSGFEVSGNPETKAKKKRRIHFDILLMALVGA